MYFAHLHLDAAILMSYCTTEHEKMFFPKPAITSNIIEQLHAITKTPPLIHPLTCRNALAGQQHDGSQADTEDGTLAKVEHGKCGCSF